MSTYESKNDRAARDDLQKLWDETEAAPDYAPVLRDRGRKGRHCHRLRNL